MSTLSIVKKASEERLRAYSDETLAALKGKALDCIAEMHKHGITVQQVTVRRDHVTIEIDRPSQWLKGSLHVTRINGRFREIVMVAAVKGCQVQWIEQDEHPLLRRTEGYPMRIHFEDQGQDFLHWDVDGNGMVTDSQPNLYEAFLGCRVLRHNELTHGDRLVYLSSDGSGIQHLAYPISEVTRLGER